MMKRTAICPSTIGQWFRWKCFPLDAEIRSTGEIEAIEERENAVCNSISTNLNDLLHVMRLRLSTTNRSARHFIVFIHSVQMFWYSFMIVLVLCLCVCPKCPGPNMMMSLPSPSIDLNCRPMNWLLFSDGSIYIQLFVTLDQFVASHSSSQSSISWLIDIAILIRSTHFTFGVNCDDEDRFYSCIQMRLFKMFWINRLVHFFIVTHFHSITYFVHLKFNFHSLNNKIDRCLI